MMEGVAKLALFALAACGAAMTVRAYRPELALQIGVAAGIVILIYAIEELSGAYTSLGEYIKLFGLSGEYFPAMLKITGIVYIMQFAADVCRDAGEGAIAGKVELAGRAMVIAVCVPMIKAVFGLISSIAGGGAL